ncbi:hypothetical protein LY76DRAFT_74313 [Colletotrichum caudatum]|nr:hypothetical protein LY76DRAFT_74313 [Colletotrichum caudatum]
MRMQYMAAWYRPGDSHSQPSFGGLKLTWPLTLSLSLSLSLCLDALFGLIFFIQLPWYMSLFFQAGKVIRLYAAGPIPAPSCPTEEDVDNVSGGGRNRTVCLNGEMTGLDGTCIQYSR